VSDYRRAVSALTRRRREFRRPREDRNRFLQFELDHETVT
jgi:hypothetical protein